MHLERKKDLSIYYWLQDLFSSYDFITVVDEFPTQKLEVPSIALDWGVLDNQPFELGNRSGNYIRSWYIDVFAQNKSQRDDYTYLILESLENSVPVYNFDEGFPAAGQTPADAGITQLGYLEAERTRIKRIQIMPELVEKLYYRSEVLFSTNYSEI